MSIIDTTTVGADAFGQLSLIDLDPVRHEVRKAIGGSSPVTPAPR